MVVCTVGVQSINLLLQDMLNSVVFDLSSVSVVHQTPMSPLQPYIRHPNQFKEKKKQSDSCCFFGSTVIFLTINFLLITPVTIAM